MSGDCLGAKEDGRSPTHSSEDDVRDRVRTEGQLGRAVAATRTDKEGEHETGRATRDVDRSATGKVEVPELGEGPAAVVSTTRVNISYTGRGAVYIKRVLLTRGSKPSERQASLRISEGQQADLILKTRISR